MQGLRLETATFLETVSPLAKEIAGLYWTMELQGGPFLTAGQPPDVVAALKRCAVGSNQLLWRPAVFPAFAHLLVSDEWGYFVGLEGPEEVALRKASAIEGVSWPADLFVEPAAGGIALVVIELEPGEWELYSPHLDWLDRLSKCLPSERIDSDHGEWVDL